MSACWSLQVDDIRSAGGEASFIRGDVTKSSDVQAAIKLAQDKYSKLDIMFNNAGISHADDDNAEATTEDVFNETLRVNMLGVRSRVLQWRLMV